MSLVPSLAPDEYAHPSTTETVYRAYVNGSLLYTGSDLEAAIRTWDYATRGAPAPAGGVAVAVYEHNARYESGLLQLRDGWILHVYEDGRVYLNPNLKEA